MRKFTNIPKSEQERLRRVYPDLANLICDIEPHDYKMVFVSVFDHCLTREEASEKLDNVAPEEQERRDSLFVNFNRGLLESTECLKVVLKGMKKDRVLFKRFNNKDYALKYISPYTWPHFVVAIPEFEALYFQSWDDTAIFFYINDKITEHLEYLSSKYGLHVYS